MGDRENDEVLPDGARVEFRFRKNGKKEKVIIEKASPEGLPPGWTKEIKVKKTGHRVRRDPYYIDPVSGYVFRSMKDAVRYVETGELGRLAYKPKDDIDQNEELEDDKDNSSTTAKKQKLAVTGMESDIISQNTKLSEVAKCEDALNSVSSGECISRSENTSDQGDAGTELRGSNLSEVKDSDKMDEGKYSTKNVLSTPVVRDLPDMQSSDGGEMTDESKNILGKCRSRKKKVIDLPRRASKRLAGLAIDPTPELKASNRTRRDVAKQSDEAQANNFEGSCSGSQVHPASKELDQHEAKHGANYAFESSKITKVFSESSESMPPSGYLNGPQGKVGTENKKDQTQGSGVALPPKNQGKIEFDKGAGEKLGPPIDLPLEDLLSDPCIAFAIKTLTGETFETSSLSVESKSSKSGGDEKPILTSPVELAAANVESTNKADEKLENPVDLPFADIWRDPCIEFAIKTLTGTIPVGNDLDFQDYFQQQVNTSQTQPSNNFCQTEFLCQQYDSLEKSVSREQAQKGNLSIQSPGGTGFHKQSKKKCNECH